MLPTRDLSELATTPSSNSLDSSMSKSPAFFSVISLRDSLSVRKIIGFSSGEKFSANCVLMGNISEKKDTQGNVVFNGEIKNIGGRRADFVKMDFVFRKNWSGETRTLTTFIQGSYNTFDSGIVSDASLLPGALGKFELYVPQDFGSFIGYSYVIDWEEYQ